jgi:hypothetical protein
VTGNGHARFLGGRAAATPLLLPGKATYTLGKKCKGNLVNGQQKTLRRNSWIFTACSVMKYSYEWAHHHVNTN